MFFRLIGGAGRLQAVLLGLALSISLLEGATGHEGHDHGAPQPAAVSTATPRVTAQSDAYELVGVLRGERLVVYLDRFATNEPVTDAKLAVTLADEEVAAQLAADGTYVVASPKLSGRGPLELVFSVTGASGDDLLIASLDLPGRAAPATTAAARETSSTAAIPASLRLLNRDVPTPYALGAGALAMGFVLGLAVRSRKKLVPLTGIAVLALVLSSVLAFGHEGHDHGDEAKAALPAGDTPRRLPDGTVFVPKPSQRLLEVRTNVTKPEQAERAVMLIGRVISDPNRSGIVQSINGGRVLAAERGLPRLGQTVKKGDVLALVEQAVGQADRTSLSERAGEIEQDIAVAETKLRRVRQLAERGVAPPSQVTDAETELDGLRRRREILRQSRNEPEILRAPIDGTIAAARVVAGQVVSSQDVIFQIVDPKGLWVEALVYGDLDPSRITGASATGPDGTPLKLIFQGFGRAMQQQATLVHFAVEEPPPNLSVGQSVSVAARTGTPVSGIILPRDAVVRASNGEPVVWRHTEPERFEARPVRTDPFDASRVIVRAGIAQGDRIVTRGAELINQIR